MDIIKKINLKLSIIDSIPESFWTHQTLIGVDRDALEEMISEVQNNDMIQPESEYQKDFEMFDRALYDYIVAYKHEISSIKFIKYTSPESVKEIMNLIGSKGILNTENGLCIFREQELKLSKNSWLAIHSDGSIFGVSEFEKDSFDNFLNIVYNNF